jgi:ABC-type lipoprotein export system ATPase subunit
MFLELKNISKTYEIPSGEGQMTVLKNLSLRINQGESIAIVGPSGSGKSTLLNIIGALDRPSFGSVTLDGKNLAELKDSELSKVRNKDIGFIFQLHHLLPQCTVLENVLIPTIPLDLNGDEENVKIRAKELLEKVGLEQHFYHFPAQLSGGELQRVAVVRALINTPKLVLADEPTGSLDRESSENLGQLLVQLNKKEGVALVVVTHSIELARLMEKVYTLQDGKLEIY